MRARHLLFLLLGCVAALLPTVEAGAQTDSLICYTPTDISPEGRGELRFNLDNITFVRDNEYKGSLAKGYTLPGIWVEPTIGYQPLRNLTLEVGLHALHYWGANKYPNLNYSDLAEWKGEQTQKGFHCLPVFRAHLQLTPAFHVVLGTIYGKTNHGLVTPLYNEELNLSADPEAGVQLLVNTRPFSLDAWVNWESFIFNDDNHQESFTFGVSTRFRPSRREARVQTYIPLQAVFQHRGGEINPDAKDRVVKTWLNAAAGFGLDIPFAARVPLGLNLEATAAFYRQQTGSALPFDEGAGIYARAALNVWRCRASLGYWHCHNFISIFGNPHFGTVNVGRDGTTYRNPSMLTAHAEYTQKLGRGFAFGVSTDVFGLLSADVRSADAGYVRQKGTLSFSAGMYLRINPSFLLKKF